MLVVTTPQSTFVLVLLALVTLYVILSSLGAAAAPSNVVALDCYSIIRTIYSVTALEFL